MAKKRAPDSYLTPDNCDVEEEQEEVQWWFDHACIHCYKICFLIHYNLSVQKFTHCVSHN